ncbi:hypothetical protein AGDE_15563 [Angomonas deanei]|uniref:Uncharacterized protein n=1 Tax=Angomonas deanei TaxID=59799 RepID=A0A7G2CA82_9TRYP|nr:hypothetical protein AGDE_15563 [Angomonas deanei]CAD2215971.1 hypothetical protein, conserved [Angomonas deanei]|eukprot:EPY18849.1 hypothetical protein AGDE_15563 [Angomonas deanei]
MAQNFAFSSTCLWPQLAQKGARVTTGSSGTVLLTLWGADLRVVLGFVAGTCCIAPRLLRRTWRCWEDSSVDFSNFSVVLVDAFTTSGLSSFSAGCRRRRVLSIRRDFSCSAAFSRCLRDWIASCLRLSDTSVAPRRVFVSRAREVFSRLLGSSERVDRRLGLHEAAGRRTGVGATAEPLLRTGVLDCTRSRLRAPRFTGVGRAAGGLYVRVAAGAARSPLPSVSLVDSPPFAQTRGRISVAGSALAIAALVAGGPPRRRHVYGWEKRRRGGGSSRHCQSGS